MFLYFLFYNESLLKWHKAEQVRPSVSDDFSWGQFLLLLLHCGLYLLMVLFRFSGNTKPDTANM